MFHYLSLLESLNTLPSPCCKGQSRCAVSICLLSSSPAIKMLHPPNRFRPEGRFFPFVILPPLKCEPPAVLPAFCRVVCMFSSPLGPRYPVTSDPRSYRRLAAGALLKNISPAEDDVSRRSGGTAVYAAAVDDRSCGLLKEVERHCVSTSFDLWVPTVTSLLQSNTYS